MSSNYHTPITSSPKRAANAATVEGPLAQLDAAITGAFAAAQAAQETVLLSGAAVTQANGAASAGQKTVTVDDSAVFAPGCFVQYALAGGTLETNTVATVNSGTQITLQNNIGTGGIADNALIAVLPAGIYNMRAGVFNALDFGAGTGASAAANKSAIQAAINACVASSMANGRVVIPAGQYACAAGLTVGARGVRIEGAGGFAQLNMSGSGAFLTVTAPDVTLSNIYLDGAHTNAGHGIVAEDAYWLKLENCRVYGAQRHQLYTNDTWWITVEDCIFSAETADSGYDAVRHAGNSNAITHRRNRFLSRAGAWGLVVEQGSALVIENCDFGGDATGNHGCRLEDTRAVDFRANYFEGVDGVMLQLAASATGALARAVNVCGNYFLFDSAATIGIEALGVAGCQISANSFYDILGLTPVAIRVAPDNHRITGLRISEDNEIYPCTVQNAAYRGSDRTRRTDMHAPGLHYNNQYFSAGDVIHNTAPELGGPLGWVCRSAGFATKFWWSGLSYTANSYCHTQYGKIYYTAAGGTAGATVPTHTNGSASDGAVTWVYVGTLIAEAAFEPFGQVGYRSGSGSPSGSVTPKFLGEEYLDTGAGKWYKSIGSANTAWVALN